MATIETVERTPAGLERPSTKRARVMIRRISPWSVLKLSLLFYFCLMLMILLGIGILYGILDSLGLIEQLEDAIEPFWVPEPVPIGPEEAAATFEINFWFMMRTLFLIGVVSSVLWAAFTAFVVLLYNLISDLVGGVEVTLTERR